MDRIPKAAVVAGRSLAVLVVLLAPALAGAAELSGAVRVIDGDSIEIGGRRLRLYAITAPALDDECSVAGKTIACGRVSRSALLDLTAGATVDCDLVGGDKDGVEPAAVCRAGGYDLSEGMTYTGWARADVRESDKYLRFEKDARRRHRGLWRDGAE